MEYTEIAWLKEMLYVILKANIDTDTKVKEILKVVKTYEAMKDI